MIAMEALKTLNFYPYIQWSAIATVAFLLLAVVAFFLNWGFRFRLIGVTAFMGVVTVSILALGLSLTSHVKIPGAMRFARVYDNGANSIVITVQPPISPSELEATLRQAASDYFSYGRVALGGDNKLTIRARTFLHLQPGISQPLYLGQIRRSLGVRNDENIEVKIFTKNLSLVAKNQQG